MLRSEQPVTELIGREEIDAEFRQRISEAGHTYIQVRGSPGSGKTSWVKQAAAAQSVNDNSGTSLALIAAAHYCSRNNAASGSGIVLLRELARQLSEFDSDFCDALLDQTAKRKSTSIQVEQNVSSSPGAEVTGVKLDIHSDNPADLIDDIFLKPLNSVLEKPGPTWLILIDAPDEPSETGAADLLLKLGELPARLRVVVTTRSETNFAHRFARLATQEINIDELSVTKSISLFVAQRSKSHSLDARITPDWDSQSLNETIVKRSHGNFLVASCTIDSLANSERPIDAALVDDLPRTLGGFYRDFLEQLPNEIRLNWPEQLGRIVGALSVARAPLTQDDLAVLCRMPLSIVHARLELIRQYLLVDKEDRWRIFHATFAEFLISKIDAGPFWCPEHEQHERFVFWANSEIVQHSWTGAPQYLLRHHLHHCLGLDREMLVSNLWDTLVKDYIVSRFNHGHKPHEIAVDFRQALEVTASLNDVEITLFLTLLVQLWNEKTASQVDASSTILLASQGFTEKASELALRQDDAAHASTTDGQKELTAYIRALAELRETSAALDLLGKAPEESREELGNSFLDQLAITHPGEAIEVIQEHLVGNTPPVLSPDACRRISEIQGGSALALETQRSQPGLLVAIAEGLAVHDLDQALEMVERQDAEYDWFGGEKIGFGQRQAQARVLLAYLDSPDSNPSLAWEHAGRLFGRQWPEPYGLALAAAFVSATPDLAPVVVEKVTDPDELLEAMLSFAWLGQYTEVRITTQNGWRPKFVDPARSVRKLGLLNPVSAKIIPRIAAIDLKKLTSAGSSLDELRTFSDVLISDLSKQKRVPETAAFAAKPLAEFMALLGEDKLLQFHGFATEHWANQSWSHAAAEGAAIGLARKGIDNYNSFVSTSRIPEVAHHSGLLAATRVISARKPDEALTLFKLTQPESSITRARMGEIIALAMRKHGNERLSDIAPHLSKFTDGGVFRLVIDQATSGVCSEVSEHGGDPAEQAVARLARAKKTRKKADIERARVAIESVPTLTGVYVGGKMTWARDLRREFGDAFLDQAADETLRLMLPIAGVDDFRRIAEAVLSDGTRLNRVEHAIAVIRSSVAGISTEGLPPFWNANLLLAFALELDHEERQSLLATLLGQSELGAQVLAGCNAVEHPKEFLLELANTSEAESVSNGEPINQLWLSGLATRSMTSSDPENALKAVNRLADRYWFHEELLIDVVHAWPAASWRDALVSFEKQHHKIGESQYWFYQQVLRPLLAKAAVVDLEGVQTELGLLAERFEPDGLDWLILDIIKEKTLFPISQTEWDALQNLYGELVEPGSRVRALEHMLVSASKLPVAFQAAGTSAVLRAVGLCHREALQRLAHEIGWAAAKVVPGLNERWSKIASRIQEILEPDAITF